MENIKKFFASPKRNAIVGLVGSILMLLQAIFIIVISKEIEFKEISHIIKNFVSLGFILYFSIILCRMNRRRGNLKIATNILIVSLILTILSLILLQVADIMNFSNIIAITLNIIIYIFLFNILKRKSTKFSNNIFLVVIVAYTIYQLVIDNMNTTIFTNEFDTRTFLIWLCNVSYLGIVPYFYNYYEILKEEK